MYGKAYFGFVPNISKISCLVIQIILFMVVMLTYFQKWEHFRWNRSKILTLQDYLKKSQAIQLSKSFIDVNLPSTADDDDVEKTFINVSESTEIVCEKSSRIGNTGDGGWNICEVDSFLPKDPCIVYSFGINNDWSFDDGVIGKYKCVVKSFDPSMNMIDQKRKPQNIFMKEGLGGKDVVEDNLWRKNTLKTLLHVLQDADKVIDYLKFDIEGDEWAVLNTSVRDGSLLKVKQIAFEIHTDEAYWKTTPILKLKLYLNILKSLRDLGFYRWYAHRNTLAPNHKSNRTGSPIWCCHELVYLNLNYL